MLFFFKLSILLLGKVLTIFLIQNNFFVLNSFTLIIVENLSSFIFFKGKYSFSNLIVFNISILLSILILHFQIHLFLFSFYNSSLFLLGKRNFSESSFPNFGEGKKFKLLFKLSLTFILKLYSSSSTNFSKNEFNLLFLWKKSLILLFLLPKKLFLSSQKSSKFNLFGKFIFCKSSVWVEPNKFFPYFFADVLKFGDFIILWLHKFRFFYEPYFYSRFDFILLILVKNKVLLNDFLLLE